MRFNAVELEETRLANIRQSSDGIRYHERHRIFPAVFEDRKHHSILDISAGVGVVARRVVSRYPSNGSKVEVICNDVSPTCLKTLRESGLMTVSFDIDSPETSYPFPDNTFDAVISLATIEHLVHIEHFLKEIRRILKPDGFLYVSAPNYSGLPYLLPFILTGKTFHDPMDQRGRYEFNAHIKYFTYRTLSEVVSAQGYMLEAVYIGLPESGASYKQLYARSKIKALAFRSAMKLIYHCFSPRWASEPVLCFQKSDAKVNGHKPKKVIL